MSGPILSVDGIGLAFGGVQALDAVSLVVRPGEVFAIIGPNGAGKTSLFNVISGLYRPTAGVVRLDHGGTLLDITAMAPERLARLGVSRSFQNLQVFFRMSAAENVMVGRHLYERRNVFANLLALPSVQRQNRESRARAEELLAFVGLAGRGGLLAGGLPYGELKRLEIARALAAEPRLLLLDEPAAGCNPSETAALSKVIRAIADLGTTVVLIEHDMKMVMRISDRIHVLNQGKSLVEGCAGEIASSAIVREAYLGRHGSEELDDAAVG